MPYLIRLSVFCAVLLAIQAHASTTVYKVLEQDENGVATHRAFDRSAVGDGIDPVMQFITLDSPTNPSTAQVLWEASETPIPWNRTAAFANYRMVEFADLPDGGRLEYRVFDAKSDEELLELRHVRETEKDGFAVDPSVINNLPDGQYELHVHVLMTDRPVHILKQLISVSDDAIDPELAPEDVLENESDTASTLKPGTGFEGETEQPAAVGTRTTNTMALWDVVPYQTFQGKFEVGVVAHHAYGMDRVEMSFNGGPWQAIAEPTLNPRTNVVEYWANIDANSIEDGRVELRAVAYPKNGTPRVLDTLVLFANANGSVEFPVLELDAGKHLIPNNLPLPEEGWFTIRPKPGVAKEDVIVRRIGQHDRGNIKFQGVTFSVGGSFRGPGKWGKLWMDDVDYSGVDAAGGGRLTEWIANHAWAKKYHTNMNISHVRAAFHAGDGIIRNVNLSDIYEDAIRQSGLIVNVKIDDMKSAKPQYHPDVFQWHGKTLENTIVQNVTANNVSGQGLYHDIGMIDCAFVDLDLNITGGYRPLQLMGSTTNVLIQDSQFKSEIDGIFRYDKGFSPKDVVLRDIIAGDEFPFLPLGWQHKQIRAYTLQEDR